jgi:methionyl-tRNA formyltransferase
MNHPRDVNSAGTPARIIFAGSPDFAVPALQVLIASRHDVVGVFTQPDRPAGRGRRLTMSPVKAAALAAGIPVFQPAKLNSPEEQQLVADLKPDLMVVVAYGLLLPQAVLDMPRLGCVNLHASLLPRWRGAAPIQAAILHGDARTGVGLMQMDAGLDTGPVLAEAQTDIDATETSGELHDRLAELGADLLADNLDTLLAGELTPQPQATGGVTYAGRIAKSDGLIDWAEPAPDTVRKVLACDPWPVAHTLYKGQPLRVFSATAEPGTGSPGQVLSCANDGMRVATGAGVLNITELQLPGRKRMTAKAFANAHDLTGTMLG